MLHLEIVPDVFLWKHIDSNLQLNPPGKFKLGVQRNVLGWIAYVLAHALQLLVVFVWNKVSYEYYRSLDF